MKREESFEEYFEREKTTKNIQEQINLGQLTVIYLYNMNTHNKQKQKYPKSTC